MHWQCLNQHAYFYSVGKSQLSKTFSQLVTLKSRTNRVPRHMHKTFLWTSYLVSQDSVCQLRILVTLSSVFISWRESGRTRAIH